MTWLAILIIVTLGGEYEGIFRPHQRLAAIHVAAEKLGGMFRRREQRCVLTGCKD